MFPYVNVFVIHIQSMKGKNKRHRLCDCLSACPSVRSCMYVYVRVYVRENVSQENIGVERSFRECIAVALNSGVSTNKYIWTNICTTYENGGVLLFI